MFVFMFLEGHLYIENNFYGDDIYPDCGGMNRCIFHAKILNKLCKLDV